MSIIKRKTDILDITETTLDSEGYLLHRLIFFYSLIPFYSTKMFFSVPFVCSAMTSSPHCIDLAKGGSKVDKLSIKCSEVLITLLPIDYGNA